MKKGRRKRGEKPVAVVGGSIRGGPPRGVPASKKMAAANRVRNWKHGRYAQTVTELEVRAAAVNRTLRPDAFQVIGSVHEAICAGNMEDLNEHVAVTAIAESELRRRDIADRLTRDGVALDEPIIGADGSPLCGPDKKPLTRVRAHPLLEHEHRINERLGHTAADLLLTKKGRGETATNLLVAAALARDNELRRADKTDFQAPPQDLLKIGGS